MTRAELQDRLLTGVRPSVRDEMASHAGEATRVLSACLRVASRGVSRALRHRPQYMAACRRELGLPVGGWLADLLSRLMMDVARQMLLRFLEALLPALIAWLQEQFNDLVQAPAANGWTPLDNLCARLAEEPA